MSSPPHLRLCLARAALLLLLSAGVARAAVPDIVLLAVVGKQATLERTDGSSFQGEIASFDDEYVSIVLADGSIVAVPRTEVAGVRLSSVAAPIPAPGPAPAPSSRFDADEDEDAQATPPAPAPKPPQPKKAAPVLSAHRARLTKANQTWTTVTTLSGLGCLAVGGGMGIGGGFAYSEPLIYGGGVLAGAGLGFSMTSARGATRLADATWSDDEVADAFVSSAVLKLALWTPLYAGLGVAFQVLARPHLAMGSADFGLYTWSAGAFWGLAGGQVGAAVYDFTVAGAVRQGGQASGPPPAFALAPLYCDAEGPACGALASTSFRF